MSRLKGIAALILAGFLCAGSPAASGCGASPQEALKEGLKALFMDRNNDKALALFQEAVKTGKPGTLFESYYYLGLTQQLLEKFPDSLDSLAQALKYAPEAEAKTSAAILPACYSIMGASHYAMGSYAEAAAAYRKSLDLAPVSLTCIAMANVHIALGQFDEAEADAERSRRIDPNAPYYYEIMGNVRAGQRHCLEAVGFYRQAAEAFPVFLDKYRRVAEAQPHFRDTYNGMVKSMNAEAAENQIGAARAFLSLGDLGDAADALDKAWQTTAGAVPSDRLCSLLADLGRFDEAAAAIGRAIGAKPADAKSAAAFLALRSLVHCARGNMIGNMNDADRAYALDPTAPWVREARAAVKIHVSGDAAAGPSLLSGAKEGVLARILEAEAYAKMNDLEKAAEIYAAIPADEPSWHSALVSGEVKSLIPQFRGLVQGKLKKAEASEASGRFDEALAEYAGAAKISDAAAAETIRRRVGVLMKAHPSLAALPDEARQKALGGDSLIKEGRFDMALREYRGAIAAAPFNPQLHINTALICGELKDYGGAVEHMTIYLQLQPDAANAAAAREGIARWQARREEDRTKARGTK